jgi:hypothetical protein
LKLKPAELEATSPGHNERMMMFVMNSVQEVVLLLKILPGVLVVMCAMLVLKK